MIGRVLPHAASIGPTVGPSAGPSAGPASGAGDPGSFGQAMVRARRAAQGGDAPRPDAPRPDAPRSDAPRSDAQRSDRPRSDGPSVRDRSERIGEPRAGGADGVEADADTSEEAGAAQTGEEVAAPAESGRSPLAIAVLDAVVASRSGEHGALPGAGGAAVSAAAVDGRRGPPTAAHPSAAEAGQAKAGAAAPGEPGATAAGDDRAATPATAGWLATLPAVGAKDSVEGPRAVRADAAGSLPEARGADAPPTPPQAAGSTPEIAEDPALITSADPIEADPAGATTLPAASETPSPSTPSRPAEALQMAAFTDASGALHRPGAAPAAPAIAGPAVRAFVAEPLASPGFGPAFAGEVDRLLIQGAQSAELVLTPRALGPIRIELSISGETASVAFSAIQPETRQAIEQSLPMLRALLAEHGLTLGQAEVGSGHERQDGRPSVPGPATDARTDPGAAAAPGGQRDPQYIARPRGLVDLFV